MPFHVAMKKEGIHDVVLASRRLGDVHGLLYRLLPAILSSSLFQNRGFDGQQVLKWNRKDDVRMYHLYLIISS
jgi:hypothetical protein